MPKKPNKPQREVTRRQLSHWQKENRIQRIIMLVGIIVIVAAIIVVGTGIYAGQFRPLQAIVIKVGDTGYDMDYYINMLAYYGKTTGADYIYYVTDLAAQKIQQIKLVRDGASALNPPVTVSDEEVKKVLDERGLSSSNTNKDVIRDELLIDKLKTDYFDKLVPQSGEQRAVLAMFLESQTHVDQVKTRLENGESFKDVATELSRENNSKSKNGDFGWVPRGVLPTILGNAANTVLDDKVFSSDIGINKLAMVEDPDQGKNIGYWLLQVTETKEVTSTPTPTPTGEDTPAPTPATTTEVHLMAMLLASQEQAEEIKAKLEAGGEGNDWATLAKEYSSYPGAADDGGDLGFVSKETLTLGTAVRDILFPEDPAQNLEVKKISDPIGDSGRTTNGGFWLIELTGIEADKAIEGDNRTKLVDIQLSDWIQKQWTDNQDKLLNNLTTEQVSFAVNKAFERLGD